MMKYSAENWDTLRSCTSRRECSTEGQKGTVADTGTGMKHYLVADPDVTISWKFNELHISWISMSVQIKHSSPTDFELQAYTRGPLTIKNTKFWGIYIAYWHWVFIMIAAVGFVFHTKILQKKMKKKIWTVIQAVGNQTGKDFWREGSFTKSIHTV